MVYSLYTRRAHLTQSLQLPEGDDTQCEIDDSVVLFPNSTVTQASVRLSLLAAAEKAR